jgi:NTP pyrophosphatase (non-canonical NTP hydrolase)
MTFDEYQTEAHSFASYGDREIYPVLALAEEAGEVVGKFAKAIRKGVDVDIDAIKKELGDVLWNVAEIATILDIDLEEIAIGNIVKLSDREDRGVIVGEGDNR